MPPPTPSQQIIWTAIPNGMVPGSSTARISVVVSPRLSAGSTTPTTLGFYQDWLNWPATNVTFELTIGTDTIPASAVTVVSPTLPPA